MKNCGMTIHNRLLSIIALVLAASFAGQAFGAGEGTAVGVNPDAVARINTVDRTLVVGADLSVGETVVTGPRGQVQIIFDDETELVVGPGSSLKLETYLLRGNHTAEKLTVNALAGTFRFISGNSPKSAYQISTPTAAIGVRGTKFDIVVTRDSTRVTLFEGALQICNNSSACAEVTEPLRDGSGLGRWRPALAPQRSATPAADRPISIMSASNRHCCPTSASAAPANALRRPAEQARDNPGQRPVGKQPAPRYRNNRGTTGGTTGGTSGGTTGRPTAEPQAARTGERRRNHRWHHRRFTGGGTADPR